MNKRAKRRMLKSQLRHENAQLKRIAEDAKELEHAWQRKANQAQREAQLYRESKQLDSSAAAVTLRVRDLPESFPGEKWAMQVTVDTRVLEFAALRQRRDDPNNITHITYSIMRQIEKEMMPLIQSKLAGQDTWQRNVPLNLVG